jgi:mannose-6-phosphate isomerase-like protein (cupin superfamily)
MERMRMLALSAAAGMVAVTTVHYAMAQTATPAPAAAATAAAADSSDYYSSDTMRAKAAELLAKAQSTPSGSASATLATYPGHYLNLTVRVKSGGAEFHTNWNDVFVVLDGEATEVIGGSIPDVTYDAKGEGHGAKVVGGTEHKLTKGDVLHIPPSTPHQTLVAPGKSFAYFVVKVAKQ